MLSCEPGNRAVTDVVGARDLAHWLAVAVAAANRLALLVLGQFRFAAELDASRFGAVASFAGAARIRSRSNSASPPSTVSISRPCDVVVSAHVSPRERKP